MVAGLGIALLPRHAVGLELAAGLLKELPVEELPLYRTLGCTRPRQAPVTTSHPAEEFQVPVGPRQAAVHLSQTRTQFQAPFRSAVAWSRPSPAAGGGVVHGRSSSSRTARTITVGLFEHQAADML